MVQYSDVNLDRIFSALGDPTRRAMLATLMRGEASVSDLGKPHSMTLAGTAKHIRVLADAGLVTHEKIGRVRTCRIRPAALKDAADWIAQYERFWTERLDALEDALHRLDGR